MRPRPPRHKKLKNKPDQEKFSMSILDAMYSGVSGLSAESDALSVIGNNVSNTSTIGFKESRAMFENVLGGAIGDPNAVGAGVAVEKSQQIFAQGTIQSTGNAT